MEGMGEGGQALKVNNGGERSPKTLLVQGGRRVFIGGEKYGRWKQPTGQFGRKSGGAGLWAGRSGSKSDGTGLFAGCPAARRTDSATHRKTVQNSSPAAPSDWPGLPPEGPAWSPAEMDSPKTK
jgi:hypothetical protein